MSFVCVTHIPVPDVVETRMLSLSGILTDSLQDLCKGQLLLAIKMS